MNWTHPYPVRDLAGRCDLERVVLRNTQRLERVLSAHGVYRRVLVRVEGEVARFPHDLERFEVVLREADLLKLQKQTI